MGLVLKNEGVQSLDRGLTILRILAENGPSTASTIADELGIHQSSASRLLKSLMKAGFVRKPTFQSFSLDYGVLEFSNLALERLPGGRAADRVCLQLSQSTGLNVAVGILRKGLLVNLSQSEPEVERVLRFLVPLNRPLHDSSLGLVMAWAQGPKEGEKLLKDSFRSTREKNDPKKTLKMVQSSMKEHGMLIYKDQEEISLNAAIPFTLDGESASLALFSHKKRKISPKRLLEILNEGLTIMSKECSLVPFPYEEIDQWQSIYLKKGR